MGTLTRDTPNTLHELIHYTINRLLCQVLMRAVTIESFCHVTVMA